MLVKDTEKTEGETAVILMENCKGLQKRAQLR